MGFLPAEEPTSFQAVAYTTTWGGTPVAQCALWVPDLNQWFLTGSHNKKYTATHKIMRGIAHCAAYVEVITDFQRIQPEDITQYERIVFKRIVAGKVYHYLAVFRQGSRGEKLWFLSGTLSHRRAFSTADLIKHLNNSTVFACLPKRV